MLHLDFLNFTLPVCISLVKNLGTFQKSFEKNGHIFPSRNFHFSFKVLKQHVTKFHYVPCFIDTCVKVVESKAKAVLKGNQF